MSRPPPVGRIADPALVAELAQLRRTVAQLHEGLTGLETFVANLERRLSGPDPGEFPLLLNIRKRSLLYSFLYSRCPGGPSSSRHGYSLIVCEYFAHFVDFMALLPTKIRKYIG